MSIAPAHDPCNRVFWCLSGRFDTLKSRSRAPSKGRNCLARPGKKGQDIRGYVKRSVPVGWRAFERKSKPKSRLGLATPR